MLVQFRLWRSVGRMPASSSLLISALENDGRLFLVYLPVFNWGMASREI